MYASSSTSAPAPSRSAVRGLVVLNVLLLAALAVVTLSPSAGAQARPRGSYLMAAGDAQGTDAGIVFIVDTVSQELVAITWDDNQKQINGVGYRNLVNDAGSALRPGAGR